MTEIQGKSILVRVSEGSSYRESTVVRILQTTELLLYDAYVYTFFIVAEKTSKFKRVLLSSTDRLLG